jgi:hypothetical protein
MVDLKCIKHDCVTTNQFINNTFQPGHGEARVYFHELTNMNDDVTNA